MSEKLKPCPFCQNKNIAIGSDGNGGQYIDCGRKHIVHFINCTKEEAINLWNTRPEEDQLKAENEALIRYIEGLTAWLKAMEDAYEEIFKKHIPEKIVVIK